MPAIAEDIVIVTVFGNVQFMQVDPRRAQRQDTFDLREQILSDSEHAHLQAHAEAAAAGNYGTDDEEHSVLEDDSDGEERDDYMDEDDDGSSSLSIPNESIDFDLVYSLHSFAATVEGQANVVKGDSLFLMDDSNSYWWLVRVLKTQEVGYIPAENIETPFERLARLNKHRNVDLASATQAEQLESLNASQDRLRQNLGSRTGSNQSHSPIPGRGARSRQTRGVQFTPALSVHRYPPAVWNEEEEEEEDIEWDDEGYEDEDRELADEQMERRREEEEIGPGGMEPDDGMQWDDAAAESMQVRQMRAAAGAQGAGIPEALQPASMREQQQQAMLRAQQQQQLEQQQRELMAQQQQQQQFQQQQALAQQQQAAQVAAQAQQQQQLLPSQVLRPSNSRERLGGSQDSHSSSLTAGPRRIDPLEATETRKLTVTPTIARDEDLSEKPYLPSVVNDKQREDERIKRQREEDAAAEEALRKKAKAGKERSNAPVSSATLTKSQPGKLRKDPAVSSSSKESEDEGKDKKKKGSMFGGIFGRKKEKSKDKSGSASIASVESGEYAPRTSEESSRSGHRPSGSTLDGTLSPTTTAAMHQQQQQQQAMALRSSVEAKRQEQVLQQSPQQLSPSTPERVGIPQVSQHASQLRQRDQQQQALYQQYLNRSPSSPPETQPSYGLQSAPSIMPSVSSPSSSGLGPPVSRPRPGSLILSSSSMDGQGPGVPDLSVIRVFAGKNLQTEATFKTVLLNASTTSADLVRQAIQRFRLPAGEDAGDYYLTVKQVEGGASAVMRPTENPLVVFEALVTEAMEMPKVKRSSVGSISSVASNLSMHPAIKKLPMNDFTDDSAVKFYLNRRSEDGAEDSANGHEGDETLIADTSYGDSEVGSPVRQQYLTVNAGPSNVTPERFTSPSFRFALQLIIYPEDLPDDMMFHPLTEAIVFKSSLRESDANASPTVSPNLRRKVFMFPKNVTVAEVIEQGLERFGILEGVVDGGDEIEDKLTKRRSSTRVRYGLIVAVGTLERELSPSSKVIDAYPRPPNYKTADRQILVNKRRSVDSAQLLGSMDDVNPDDPIFILRRATSYRNSTSRHRTSAPLDEIALQHLHRESASSGSSDPTSPTEEGKIKQPSRQEIIAAQRAVTRANQRAILSAQTNSVRGTDVLLPGNAMLRSSRYDANDRMRYSYVEPDGETYDISDIVEREWRDNVASKNDLLESVLVRNKDAIGDKLDRVLSKIKSEKNKEKDLSSLSSTDSRSSQRSASPSVYSVDDGTAVGGSSRSVTPGSAALTSKMPGNVPVAFPRSVSAAGTNADKIVPPSSRPGTTTPTGKPTAPGTSRRHPSIASVMSDLSGYETPPTNPGPLSQLQESPRSMSTPKPQFKRPFLPKDDFGVDHMMAVIECKALQPKAPHKPLDPVDELLFGPPLDLEALHPQIRDIYASGFKQLEEVDKMLDDYLQQALTGY